MKTSRAAGTALLVALLAACAGGGSAGRATLEAAGLKKPAGLAEANQAPRSVAIRLHAANKLNVDARGQPLALVARIYKLRQSAAFEQAPYPAFLDPQAEKEALGADLLEVKEVTLVPGQRYEVIETVSREAGWLGVVALFHAPAPQRWRLAFNARDAEQAGLTVGLHACALSAGAGATPLGATRPSSVHCQ